MRTSFFWVYLFISLCLYPFQSREHGWPPDQQDHSHSHWKAVWDVSSPTSCWKEGQWWHQIRLLTALSTQVLKNRMLTRPPFSENKLNCLAVLVGKNLFLKASLPALYICRNLHFFSYQAPLDTLTYWLRSDSLIVVSSPGWTRPALSASAHRTSASAPLVAPAELPTGCLCLSRWGAEEGKTGCRTPDAISLPSICWLSNSGCSWPSLLPGFTAQFPNTFFFPEYSQCYS